MTDFAESRINAGELDGASHVSKAAVGWRWAHRLLNLVTPMLLCAVLQACGGSSGGSTPAPAPSFTLSGSVSHLDVGGLVITNGAEQLTLPQNATSFSFSTPIPNAGAYNVAIASQATGENCVVNNGSGSVVTANVSTVAIVCNTAIVTPTMVDVIPVGPSALGYRILLPVSMVGTGAVALSAVLDTGSAGTVLNANDLSFPTSILSDSGFVIPAGQTSVTYNGITITNVVATRTYGGQSALMTMDTGNIGFAQLTIGAGVKLTTKSVPVLFVYKTTVNNQTKASTSLSNLIGVNATAAPFTVPSGLVPAGSPTPFCSPSTTTTCLVTSPLRSFTFSANASEGFTLNKITLNSCSLTPVSACPVQNALMVGLNSAAASGFNIFQLDCTTPTSPNAPGEKVCSQVVQNVKVTSTAGSFTGPAIIDSGEPQIRLTAPKGNGYPTTPTLLAAGTMIGITLPPAFSYGYTTASGGPFTTTVEEATSPTDFSNLGIAFFTQNSFLLDYAGGGEGWK